MHRPALLTLSLLASPLGAQGAGFWEFRQPVRIARQEVGAAVLGGLVYVAGGLLASLAPTNTVEVYDPAAGSWSRLPANMPTTLHHFGMAALGGKLYAVGGYVSQFVGVARCSCYDPATGQWTRISDLPQPRGALVAVALGGKLYAVGGIVPGRGAVGDLTEYDPQTNRWRTLAPMPTAREHTSAAAVGGLLYVAGGRAGRLFNQLECYDPATNMWASRAPMPTARGGNGAAALDGKLIVVGGEGSALPGGNFPQTEEYDPQTNSWRSLANMVVPLHGMYPVTVGGEILVAGGGIRAGFAASRRVIAFRRLPTGAQRYGISTAECNGPIHILPNQLPEVGRASFALLCTPTAPASAPGALVLGAFPDTAGQLLLGIRLHVALTPPWALVPTMTDPQGAAQVSVPLPANAVGARFFSQFLWANTGACVAPGTFSASDALDVTIQPRS